MNLDSNSLDSELPFPPAVTRRAMTPAAGDDALLMPPFSRASLRPADTAVASRAPEMFVAPRQPAPAAAPPIGAAPTLPAAAPDPDPALADEVAGRLEHMAAALRAQGFHALLQPRSDREPIDVVLASVIAGFLARR